jgi:hypothetical protein
MKESDIEVVGVNPHGQRGDRIKPKQPLLRHRPFGCAERPPQDTGWRRIVFSRSGLVRPGTLR